MPRSVAAFRTRPLASSRASWRRFTSSRSRRRPTWRDGAAAHPDGPRGLRRHHAPLLADRPRAPMDAAIAARGRADRAVQTAAHLQRPRGDRAGGAARARRRAAADAVCVRPHRRPANWSGCFRVGTATPGRFRCTTRAEGCCRRRRGSSSTSCRSGFGPRNSRGWSTAAETATEDDVITLHSSDASPVASGSRAPSSRSPTS